MILLVVLHKRETLSLVSGKEHMSTVFDNREFGSIFGSRRKEVTGGWRKLHNLYPSASIIRMIKSRRIWDGHSM
jgi:hypothetical protein